jgi:two-component system chemotaxis response regulator CheY
VHDVVFLVVDDSPTIKMLVKRVLENKIGAKIIHMAGDGREALDILKKEKVDFILSDWEMPHVSGDELLFQVRQNADWKNIPFIMMTSHGGKDFIMTAVQSGVTHYLVKPFTAGEMEDRIRKSWNAAAKRRSDRFSALPPHHLVVKNQNKSFQANLMDISKTGCLLRMEYSDELKLFGQYELSVEFETPEHNKTFAVNPISGVFMRLENDSGNIYAASRLCQVAVYFNPRNMDKRTEEKLDELVKWLASLSPDMIVEK